MTDPKPGPARPPTVVGLGQVLWDLLPGGKQLGGAPTNFAYHAHALGSESWVVTRVGRDPLGAEILERFRLLGLPTEGVAVDSEAPTGTVSVELTSEGQPHYTIHENVAWDRLEATPFACALMARAEAVCFGSLSQRSPTSRAAIQSLVAATLPGALRVFDINLRQPFYSREVVMGSLKLASVLKINDHELAVLAEMFNLRGEAAAQMVELAERFNLATVALTRGARGSRLYADGRFSDHPGIPAEVLDTVGAGDAFTAVLTLGLLAGWDLEHINASANELAAYVCSQPGATPPLPPAFKSLFGAGDLAER